MFEIKDKKIAKAAFLLTLSFFCLVVFVQGPVQATAWSLLPPAIAIFLAFVSGRLGLSLFSAVAMGSFSMAYGQGQGVLLSLFSTITRSLKLFAASLVGEKSVTALVETSSVSSFFSQIAWTNLQILGFVFCILTMVHVMTASGGLHAMVHSLQKWVKGPKSAQLVTAILGCLIFIDDYANTMIVGSTMRKVTDRFGVSREKLAFLVDATSAPVAGVALVSTWIGYEVGLFSEMSQKFNWGVDGYSVFLEAIPFRFYCFFMLFFVFANVLFDVDFGPMKGMRRVKPFEQSEGEEVQGHISFAVFPLALLLFLVFSLLWWDGGGFAPDNHLYSLTSWRNVLTSSENGIWILFLSSVLAFSSSLLLAVAFSKQSAKNVLAVLGRGVRSAGLPIMILVLAWSLKEICDQMNTGEFIVESLSGKVSPQWLPLTIFFISAVTAFSTGTSWGTMAILIPTVTPLAVTLGGGEYGVFICLCLASILDGAIMGDHCSPISDTTIMSSISTDCDLLNHVRTQLPYSLVVGGLAVLFGYLPAGMGWSLSLTVPFSLVVMVGLFWFLKNSSYKKGSAS